MRRSGFTLIELSIVLVIIGLVVGGVIVGSDMIYNAKVRRMIAEIDQFKSATNAFKLKYNCIPGDCTNGYELFGSDCGTNDSDYYTGCNGNGDGQVNPVGVSGEMLQGREMLKYWLQLKLANLLPINVNGTYNDTPSIRVGENIPESTAFSGAGYSVQYDASMGGNSYWLGKNLSSGNNSYIAIDSFINPSQAYAIDTKFDDGKPSTGSILGYAGIFTVLCLSGSAYNTAVSTPACVFAFPRAF